MAGIKGNLSLNRFAGDAISRQSKGLIDTPEKLVAFLQLLENTAIQVEELYKEARRDTEQAARTHRMG